MGLVNPLVVGSSPTGPTIFRSVVQIGAIAGGRQQVESRTMPARRIRETCEAIHNRAHAIALLSGDIFAEFLQCADWR